MPSKTFTSPGVHTWEVPKGVDVVDLDVRGGGSGTVQAGRVGGRMKVKNSWTLWVLVGEAGDVSTSAAGGKTANGGGGAGGDASPGRNGGNGGGGASAVRLSDANGTIKVVAGGGGGRSGDGGAGGQGGGPIGEHGSPASASVGIGNATGGTQTQGGKGGTAEAGTGFYGADAGNGALDRGGRGGQRTATVSHGGGGGGGGYRAGGGGQAAVIGDTPGGGGGGGSNFTGGITSALTTSQGGGGTGDGAVTISWANPAPANQPPGIPGDVKVDGKPESTNMATRSTGKLEISAVVRDNDSHTVDPVHDGDPATQEHGKVRLLVRWKGQVAKSDFVDSGKRATVKITGLSQATNYDFRLYAEDTHGLNSTGYNGVSVWTNRPPNEPRLISPPDNGTVTDLDNVTFDWSHDDPDPGDPQHRFQIRWRHSSTPGHPAGDWTRKEQRTSTSSYLMDAGTLTANRFYEWTVRTQDAQESWGGWAAPREVFVLGTSTPPRLRHPINQEAEEIGDGVLFSWTFRDPGHNNTQQSADLRWRAFGSTEWFTLFGITQTETSYRVAADSFEAGHRYEWAVRTTRTSDSLPSEWSEPESFWTIATLDPTGFIPVVEKPVDQGTLGIGSHRVYIYDRGGLVPRGEITPLVSVTWSRKRDDIGEATITTNGFGTDCGDLLRNTHCWLNEVVIFRSGVRVFEGPITLLTDTVDGFSIQAKDVMGYVSRRIMRQGYNDSYHVVNGQPEGLLTSVRRATLILSNALARNDPNVLPYLTPIEYDDDARQSRVVPDYGKTAWEEVDDMAANAGLDYSVIGRRIILNDTHRAIGRLPQMRPIDFASPPVISEYGMLLADRYAVTNNAGQWGEAVKPDSPYGGVELLVSSFSEQGSGGTEVLTRKALAQLRAALSKQAERGIAQRYPVPYVVRVPDNTQLMPSVAVGINQLVPGVWIPLLAQGTAISMAQWQKLDALQVVEEDGKEQVQVTMSPAPNRGEDPDAEAAAEAEE